MEVTGQHDDFSFPSSSPDSARRIHSRELRRFRARIRAHVHAEIQTTRRWRRSIPGFRAEKSPSPLGARPGTRFLHAERPRSSRDRSIFPLDTRFFAPRCTWFLRSLLPSYNLFVRNRSFRTNLRGTFRIPIFCKVLIIG